MSQMMQIKISGGPSMLTIRCEDMETGRLLPVTEFTFGYDQQGHLAAKATLLIHQVDVTLETEVEITEEIVPVPPKVGKGIRGLQGVIVRDPRDAPASPDVVD